MQPQPRALTCFEPLLEEDEGFCWFVRAAVLSTWKCAEQVMLVGCLWLCEGRCRVGVGRIRSGSGACMWSWFGCGYVVVRVDEEVGVVWLSRCESRGPDDDAPVPRSPSCLMADDGDDDDPDEARNPRRQADTYTLEPFPLSLARQRTKHRLASWAGTKKKLARTR